MFNLLLPTRNLCSSCVANSKHINKLTRRFFLQEREKRHGHVWQKRVEQRPRELLVGRGTQAKTNPRTRALSQVLLNHITEMMATGDMGETFTGFGLEISEVRVQPNVQGITVHWICSVDSRGDSAQHLEQLLHQQAWNLRHQLSQLRVLGHLPPITFVKDERHHMLEELDKLLAKADYGEDFIPTDPTLHMKAPPSSLPLTLHPSIKETIECMQEGAVEDPWKELFEGSVSLEAGGESEDAPQLPPHLPLMRHDVLGVNTSHIYKMVGLHQTRSRGEHRRQIGGCEGSVDTVSGPQDTAVARRQHIKQWAEQYKAQHRKEARMQNKENSLLYVQPETPDYEVLDGFEEEDFIEEEDVY